MAALAPPEVPIDAATLQTLPEDFVQLLEDSDFSPIWRKAIYDLEADHRGFWDAEATPDGLPWAPLSEYTIRRKGHGLKLIETLRLRNSMTVGGMRSDGESVREIVDEGANKGFSFGTSVPYAGVHQFGTDRVPQREFAGFTEERIQQIEQDLLDHIEGLITGG